MTEEKRPMSARTRDINAGIEECALSAAIRREKIREEERQNRFAKKVITEHERTASRASASSAKARDESQKMDKEISRSKATLKQHAEAEEEFKEKMGSIVLDEEDRIREEKALEEEIKENGGKLPGYFAVPSFMKDKSEKVNARSRSPRSRMLIA